MTQVKLFHAVGISALPSLEQEINKWLGEYVTSEMEIKRTDIIPAPIERIVPS